MTGTIYEQLMAECGQYHPSETTSTPGDPVAILSNAVSDIETALANAGHTVDQTVHDILNEHLTVSRVLGHAADVIGTVEATPVARALETAALGPAGEAFIADIIGKFSQLVAAQQPAPAA